MLTRDAQLCYICAGDFERLVASWTDSANKSTENLQELVELVTFLQKAVERQGRTVEITGNLASLLSHYAMLLASQGRLSTALNYLGTSQNQKINDLRDRLHVTLGKKPMLTTQRSRHSVSSYVGGSTQNFGMYNSTQNQFTSSNQFGKPTPAGFGQFNAGLPNAATSSQPWQPQVPAPAPMGGPPPKTYSPAPSAAPPQPPRPGSVGSAHGDSGIRTRSKYVLDPSVNPSNPYMTPSSFGTNPVSSPALFNTNNFQTDALANANNSTLYGQPSSYSAAGPVPQSSLLPPSMSSPAIPAPIPAPALNPSPLIPSGGYNNAPISTQPTFQAIGGAGDQAFGYQEIAQPAISAMNSLPSTVAPGWNDPPVLHKASRMQPKRAEPLKQDPITHPLYGSSAPTHQPFPSNEPLNASQPSNSYAPIPNAAQTYPSLQPGLYNPPNSQPSPFVQNFEPQQQNQNQQQPFTPQQHPFIPQQQSFAPPTSTFNSQMINQTGFNQNTMTPTFGDIPPQPQVAEVAYAKPEPIQKPPVPDEHQKIQIVLDELRSRCLCVANNPQTKRKLEEVSRKLEVLYDLLRDQKLSPNTLEALHEMVRLVESGDYMGGLQLHTQLVSGPDFSQIAGFMPGLKVLLQCAIQLQVYIR
ncbi:protein transport protein Sec31A-like [Agrilus planipennis]|nr:protein transport protein Sec31A-like [Agrilus planipennis]